MGSGNKKREYSEVINFARYVKAKRQAARAYRKETGNERQGVNEKRMQKPSREAA